MRAEKALEAALKSGNAAQIKKATEALDKARKTVETEVGTVKKALESSKLTKSEMEEAKRVVKSAEDYLSATRFGAKGPRIQSKTVYQKDGVRIDVENPNPGQRAGQIHVQVGKEKFYYDPATKTFKDVPHSLRKVLETTEAKSALEKALRMLGEK